jgi:hypothetical protein
MGVEFNTTGRSDYQVLDEDCASFFQPYRLRNMRGAAKRTAKYFTERRAGSNLIPLFERKNDTLIRRYGPSSELKKRWYRGQGGILKKFKQLKSSNSVLCPRLMRRLVFVIPVLDLRGALW